jgi:hypothetical protein
MAREIQRGVLPFPGQPSFGPVTYLARDADANFPPVEPQRSPRSRHCTSPITSWPSSSRCCIRCSECQCSSNLTPM